jgi:hypothetical protein
MAFKFNFISIPDFRELHPDVEPSSSDAYYVSLAKRILQILMENPLFAYNFDPDWLKKFALRSVGYFEDVVSHFGLFAGFRKSHLKMFGKKLPFYITGSNYLDEGVNFQDIQFILWATLQEFTNETEGDQFMNPETPVVEMMSQIIFNVLNKEYNTAPKNERIYYLLHESPCDDFFEFRVILHWLHYNSYLSMNYPLKNLKDQEKKIRKTPKKELDIAPDHLLYLFEKNKVITNVCSPLAIKAIDWFREITTNHQLLKKIEKIDFRPFSSYKIVNSNDDIIYLSLCGNDNEKEILELARNSLGVSDKKDEKKYRDKEVIKTALVYFNGLWHINGFAFFTEMSDTLIESEKKRLEEKERRQHNLSYAHNQVLEHNKNRPIAFFRNCNEWRSFCLTLFSDVSNIDELYKENPFEKEHNLVLFSDKKTGVFVLPDLAKMIKTPWNNLYDHEIATDHGLAILTGLYSTSLDFLEYVIDNNYIPDVAMNSLKGKEYGRKLLQNNKWFVVRFFQPYLFDSDFI